MFHAKPTELRDAARSLGGLGKLMDLNQMLLAGLMLSAEPLGLFEAPAANGWRAASDESRTVLTLGSLARARAIDSFVAW